MGRHADRPVAPADREAITPSTTLDGDDPRSTAVLGNQVLQQAIDVLITALSPDPGPGPWLGPHQALSAISQARTVLDQAETIAREQLRTGDTDRPIGQRVPVPAEVEAAPSGTAWTFPYPDDTGHLTVTKDAAKRWTLLHTDYAVHREQPMLALPHGRHPYLLIPAQAERALTRGWPTRPPSRPRHSAEPASTGPATEPAGTETG